MTVFEAFPEIKLDPNKSYIYCRIRKGIEPPGTVIREKDGLYLIEKKEGIPSARRKEEEIGKIK